MKRYTDGFTLVEMLVTVGGLIVFAGVLYYALMVATTQDIIMPEQNNLLPGDIVHIDEGAFETARQNQCMESCTAHLDPSDPGYQAQYDSCRERCGRPASGARVETETSAESNTILTE